MVPVAFKGISVVAAGLLLGAFGASFVDPVPKGPEPQPWQLSGRGEFTAPAASYQFVEAGPENLSPDSYAPSWASDPTLWQAPEPRIAEWEPEPYPSLAELDARLDAQVAELEEAEQVGSEAEAAAEEALAQPEPPTDTAAAPQLAGIY